MELQKLKGRFEAVNARIIALTTDEPAKNNRIANRLKLTIPILSDGDGALLKKLGMWDTRWKITDYGFYVLDKELNVLAHSRGVWHVNDEIVQRFIELFKSAS